MGYIGSFEELIAWQKARELTRAVYQVTHNGLFARDYGLSSQLQRASVSIISNIAERFERDNRKGVVMLPVFNSYLIPHTSSLEAICPKKR